MLRGWKSDLSPEDMARSLQVVPVTIEEANEFVRRFHRHHQPPQGYKFAVAVANGQIVGVAIVGRPIARHNDDGFTLEITRTCTDGTKNANSMLYGACWRAARALGYRQMIPEMAWMALRTPRPVATFEEWVRDMDTFEFLLNAERDTPEAKR
jgi:hypothetical protein